MRTLFFGTVIVCILAALAGGIAYGMMIDAERTLYQAKQTAKGVGIGVLIFAGVPMAIAAVTKPRHPGRFQVIDRPGVAPARQPQRRTTHRTTRQPERSGDGRYQPFTPNPEPRPDGYGALYATENAAGTPLAWDDDLTIEVRDGRTTRAYRIPARFASQDMFDSFWIPVAQGQPVNKDSVACSRDQYTVLLDLMTAPRPHGLGVADWHNRKRHQEGWYTTDRAFWNAVRHID